MCEKGQDEEARKYFARSLILRTKMIDLLIDILRELNVDVVIAPYEADAQIAYMVKEGLADFAISEDSDLIAYGCPRVLMKLNFQGSCQIFDWNDFKANTQISTDKNLSILQKMTREQFVQACIMGGCEYLPSIQQVGLKVAVRLFGKHKTIEEVIASLKSNKAFKDRVPEQYFEALKRVEALFFYQTVFDRRSGKLTSLQPIPEEFKIEAEFLGDRSPLEEKP